MTLDQIAGATTALGVTGLLVGALFGLYKEWWVPGWVHRQTQRDRDEWKSMALELMSTTSDVAKVAQQTVSMTPEQAVETLRVLGIKSAEDARRAVIEAGDRNRMGRDVGA